jgi:tRNA threonylcarbamoyladenosine biosynthesis protein TsaB
MRVLLISTCGVQGVVALANEEGVLTEQSLPGRGASEALMPTLRRVLAASGCTVAELSAIAVVDGPGSFTGARVGLAAAKGLCQASGARLIALSRLALLAGPEGAVTAVLDAGRNEYFCGVYRDGLRISEELLNEPATVARIAGSRACACEQKVAAALGIELAPEPGAQVMLAAARVCIARGEWSDLALSDANYLRRTDAEIKVGGG